MKNLLFAICLFLAASTTLVQAAEQGKCSATQKFMCPNIEACPESGFSYVKDCLDCSGNLSTDNKNKMCFDRKIFNGKDNPPIRFPYLWRDIVGMLVWFVAAGVATACGVGGGGIYVPLGIVLINFAPKQASGLSQSSIFGASLGGLILNLRNRHPYTSKLIQTGAIGSEAERTESNVPTNEDGEIDTATTKHFTRPLIDFDMALFLAPMEMAGAVLGVVIQTILPNWLYLFAAAIILGFTARKTFLKWQSTRAEELEKAAKEAVYATEQEEEALTSPDTERPTIAPEQAPPPAPTLATTGSSDADEDIADDEDHIIMDDEKMAKRLYFLERDARQYPTEKLIPFALLWLGLTLLTFFKGGKGVPSLVGINCTSPWYYALIGFQFLWTFGFAAYFAVKVTRETAQKKACGYPFHEHDVLWDYSKTRFYSFFTFIAGIVAGLIGIGGGMVLGPLMLVMGIYPRVSTATTASMIVLTSSGVAISYVTSGLVPWEYAVTFFFTCFAGALMGKTKIDAYVKKTGKASVLIFILATIIALSTLGALLIALLRLNANNWCFPRFKQFCSIDDGTEDIVCVPMYEDRMLGGDFYGDVIRGGL